MLFVLLLSVVSAYTDLEYEVSFKTFLKEHNKVYEGIELVHRYNVFKKSMDAVLEHNSGDHSWTVGINKFSDLTAEEFESTMLGYIGGAKRNSSVSSSEDFATIDWRKKGATTPVKNQGHCGSCWAFSTTGGIEASEFIDTGFHKIVSLSEQALVDCSGSYGNQGCNGGLMDNAFKFVKANGIPTEYSYPYTGVNGRCKKFTSATKITSFTDVTNLEEALQDQPLSVAVDARKWSSYTGGTFACSGRVQLDHGVLLVASYPNYWVIKNSWGSSWGLNGYIQLSKATGSNCGVNQAASYPSGATRR